jgi:hypothetical protein
VYGVMLARGGPDAAAQRRRWEFGRKALKTSVLPRLWKTPHMGWLEKVVSFVELTMPTLVSMALIAACFVPLNTWAFANSLATSDSFSRVSASTVLLLGSSCLICLSLVGYAVSPFLVFRLPWSYLITFLYVPFYAVWKLVIAVGGRPTHWVRTAREEAGKKRSNRSDRS